MKTKNIYHVIEFCILAGLLGFLLWWRFQVGQQRFFDVDEFTHMHWAANIAAGQKPYIDFFTFFTPGFYWLLTPLFWLYPQNPMIFMAARTMMFVNFLGILGLLGVLFAMLRSRRWALLPVIILVFLPMPYDKFLEIRPDNVATLLALAGVVAQVWAIKNNNVRAWFLSGICYGASMVVLVKTLPFVAMGGLVALILFKKRNFLSFCLGLAIPIIVFLFWMLTLGHFSTVWYALTRLAFEANTIGRVYIMEPHLFFFPNISFYGGWGITEPLLLNHGIWFVGILVGSLRFLTPFLTGDGKRENVLSEVLLSGIFILSVIGYVTFFPLKHSQYLIPIAIFIAFYSSEILVMLLGKIGKTFGSIAIILTIAVFAWIIGKNTVTVNTHKLTMTNTVQIQQTKELLSMIAPKETVLDLDGRLIFWRDPYYICCLPFGSFTQFLSRPPASVSQVLEEKKVPYIYQGDSGRLSLLWNDLSYINEHYARVPGWGDSLWKRKD